LGTPVRKSTLVWVLIPGPITAQRILDKPEREEDLGSVKIQNPALASSGQVLILSFAGGLQRDS